MSELFQPPVIAAVALLVTILALAGGSLYRLGRIISRVEEIGYRVNRLDDRIDRLDDRVERAAQEMHAEMRAFNENMQRNHEQLLAALAGHTHDEAGQSVFRSPL